MTDSKKYADRPERNCVKCGILFSGYRCKACQSKRKKEYIEKNRERVYEYNNKWARENREKVNEWQKIWRERNPEKIKEYWAKNRARHAQRRLEILKKWRSENKAHLQKYSVEYRTKNATQVKEKRRQYEIRFSERVRANKHTRRTRILGLGSKIDPEYVKFLKIVQGMKCNYCGQHMDKYQIDHIVPIARGGDNSNENLQLLCAPCNRQKGAKTDIEYREYLNVINS